MRPNPFFIPRNLTSQLEWGSRALLSGIVFTLLVAILAIILHTNSETHSPKSVISSDIRLIPASDALANPELAIAAIQSREANKSYSAQHQPTGPFWISFPISGTSTNHQKVVELRMLRATAVDFWALRHGNESSVSPVQASNEKGGISVRVELRNGETIRLIGKISPIGVSRPKVFLWDAQDFHASLKIFERGGGALIGAFVILAFFSFTVGLLNKDWSFFLFSGWLITSLRVASINDGWDLIWLGIHLAPDNLLIVFRATLAAHPLLTVALFLSLLGHEIKEPFLIKSLSVALAAFSTIFLLSPFLEHSLLLPIIWISAALGMFLILTCLAAIIIRTRSGVSMWYAASWALTFLGTLAEVGYASGISSISMAGLNSQTASIASALATAIALAEKLRSERSARLIAQKGKLEVLEKFQQNYNSMPVGLFNLDSNNNIVMCNPAFQTMFGMRNLDDTSRHIDIDHALGNGVGKRFRDVTATAPSDFELHLPATSSQPERWFLARVTSKDGSVEGSIQEITSRKEAEEQLRRLVDHDPLTGLLNQRGLEQALSDAQSLAAEGVPSAVAQLSLDRFKLINDLYGHATGDVMLQQAAARLKQSARGRDRIARLADSFIVVFIDCPDFAILGLSERLREAINVVPFELDGKRLDMTASVGVVGYDTKLTAVDTVVAAGRACAEAKARGRNCVVRLDDRDTRLRSHLDELKVVANLKQKLNTDRYFLDFQPIVSLHAPDESLSYEVLLRMRDESGGVIPPGRFIGAAERNGLMSDIDRWVLRSTLEWMDANPAHRDRLNFATINISGASLNDARFVDDAFAMIADHPLAMPKLCFEITESVALIDIGSTRRFIDRVRMYGSKLALDDFGAGYTSFNYLKDIPADFIKIDGSFVKDINLDPANYAITRTIVDLTHELGMRSIAEWAETPDTVATLIELQVDYGQGFGLVRPMEKELVTAAHSGGELIRDEQVRQLFTRVGGVGMSQRRDVIRRPR